MGIPIIQELFDGIRWLIAQFLFKIPKPLGILIFLLFLLLFGNLMNLFFELGGVHCTQDKEVVKTAPTDIYNNFRIILSKSDRPVTGNNLTFDEMFPNEPNIGQDCYILGKNTTDPNATESFWDFLGSDDFFKGFEECNLNNASDDCRPYLTSADQRNCTSKRIQDETDFGRTIYEHICVDDAYYQKFRLLNIEKLKPACPVPKGFVWNFTDGRFYCVDNDVCGENVSVNVRYSTLLDETGAKAMYNTTRNTGNINQILYFRCNNNLNPRVTLFGLDIFAYQYWVLLIVLYIMFMGIVQIHNMKRR